GKEDPRQNSSFHFTSSLIFKHILSEEKHETQLEHYAFTGCARKHDFIGLRRTTSSDRNRSPRVKCDRRTRQPNRGSCRDRGASGEEGSYLYLDPGIYQSKPALLNGLVYEYHLAILELLGL